MPPCGIHICGGAPGATRGFRPFRAFILRGTRRVVQVPRSTRSSSPTRRLRIRRACRLLAKIRDVEQDIGAATRHDVHALTCAVRHVGAAPATVTLFHVRLSSSRTTPSAASKRCGVLQAIYPFGMCRARWRLLLALMAKSVVRTVNSSCSTCALCAPGNVFQGLGRNLGRAAADLSTLGVTALARRKCRVCAHPMSEHHKPVAQSSVSGRVVTFTRAPAAVGAAAAAVALPPAGWYPQGDGQRYWDGMAWTQHYAAIGPR